MLGLIKIINNILKKSDMDKKLYQLMIFQQDNLIYYTDFVHKSYNYEQLQQTHRIQNCLGLSKSIGALVKQIHPDHTTQFRNFKTKQYQYNLHQTINQVKFILITSVLSKNEDDQVQNWLNKIYQAYIDIIKRNYLYKHGQIINNEKFETAVMNILFRRSS